MLMPADIQQAFAREGMMVFSEPNQFQQYLLEQDWENANLLLMSSGNYDGMNVKEFAENLVK
jgi:UDP-N-acetylmuramate: L-alanyl-gamma-D-glutamyl-meso-diaminopimelate ligase